MAERFMQALYMPTNKLGSSYMNKINVLSEKVEQLS